MLTHEILLSDQENLAYTKPNIDAGCSPQAAPDGAGLGGIGILLQTGHPHGIKFATL